MSKSDELTKILEHAQSDAVEQIEEKKFSDNLPYFAKLKFEGDAAGEVRFFFLNDLERDPQAHFVRVNDMAMYRGSIFRCRKLEEYRVQVLDTNTSGSRPIGTAWVSTVDKKYIPRWERIDEPNAFVISGFQQLTKKKEAQKGRLNSEFLDDEYSSGPPDNDKIPDIFK
ncbi:MAG: hypothetical protein JSW41_01640 [Candidatus Aenigmatarchaeota archaeon]|nr:MAG: hypothetical protein JSW41_01640 [Candidatus Aenigmarchaeota archaeon]